jgi:hypothetical protein
LKRSDILAVWQSSITEHNGEENASRMPRKASLVEKHRSDYRTWKKTSRDEDGMLLVAQQKFVRLDTLGERFAPNFEPMIEAVPKKEEATADGNSPEKRKRGGKRTGLPWPRDRRHRMMAVGRIANHWVDPMGFAEIWQPYADQPAWVRLTQSGLEELHLDVDENGDPYWTELPWPEMKKLRDDGKEYLSHYHRINQVRLALARGDVKDIPKKHTWHSEREVEATLPKKVRGVRLPHKTDGYIELDVDWSWEYARRDGSIDLLPLPRGSRIAIEVELSRKRFEAYEQFILPDLLKFYDFALYFAYDDAYDAVVKARRDYLSSNDERRRVRIIQLQHGGKGE